MHKGVYFFANSFVRDPAARAISQYRHSVTMGDISMGPTEFVDTHEWGHAVATSSYARQLEPYLSLFARDKILIVDFGTLTRAPQTVMDAVFDFIGVLRMPIEAESHNEAAELAKVPAAALRLAQSPLGRAANRVVGRAARDRVRKMLSIGQGRAPDPFPDWVMERLRRDLEADAKRFRSLVGRSFEGWSV
ncbi:MAG: sulfotransferase domain-containing protein [Pseudomonadota bacterium]